MLEHDDGAGKLLEKSLALSLEIGDRLAVASSLHWLGHLANIPKRMLVSARSTICRAWQSEEVGDEAGIAMSLEGMWQPCVRGGYQACIWPHGCGGAGSGHAQGFGVSLYPPR